jgi:molybdopterin converting factor small subunit
MVCRIPFAIKQVRKVGALADPRRYSWQVRGRMRIKVLYFGVLRDRFGCPDEVAELEDGATVGALLELLRGRTSKKSMGSERESSLDERLWRSLAVAVNREYGSASIVLRDGDEVALLPPVSGGCGGDSAGAKAPLFPCGFMARLKPCPSGLAGGVKWIEDALPDWRRA